MLTQAFNAFDFNYTFVHNYHITITKSLKKKCSLHTVCCRCRDDEKYFKPIFGVFRPLHEVNEEIKRGG